MLTIGPLFTLGEVAEELATSHARVCALVRRGDLHAGRLGGRNQRRVARADLDAYIERMYAETTQWIAEHPFEAVRESRDEEEAGE